jgi:acyl-CoA reductase-like NAD-dependent aldehyde dehydrogenase
MIFYQRTVGAKLSPSLICDQMRSLDPAHEAARKQMTDAETATRRAPAARTGAYPLMIGGEAVTTSATFEAINPSTGQAWAQLAEASTADVDAAVSAARRALGSWRRSGPTERQALLSAIADRIESDGEWPVLLATENGRPIREAEMADVPTAVAIFRYYAGLVRGHGGLNVFTDDPSTRVWTVREPVGVVASLIPWNSPLISTALKVAPALAAGCTVVLKPSELASASVVEFGLRTADLIPPGVVNILTGFGPDAGAALVAHPGIDKISFTGGVPTARHILHAAADQITPAILELGGKSAFVICPDADLEAAVADALMGIAFQNGQVCFAASRLFVHDELHDAFVARFVQRMGEIRIGDALDPATQVGPLVSAAHRDRVRGYVDAALAEGATVLAGGRDRELGGDLAGGFYFEPAIVADPDGRTTVAREEVFGPVTTIQRWSDEEDVIARANATEFGLAAGVWTRDLARAHRFAERLEAGTVWVNTWFDVTPGQPLGGIKASGYGREMSEETLLEYSVPKAIAMRTSVDRPELWG